MALAAVALGHPKIQAVVKGRSYQDKSSQGEVGRSERHNYDGTGLMLIDSTNSNQFAPVMYVSRYYVAVLCACTVPSVEYVWWVETKYKRDCFAKLQTSKPGSLKETEETE